MIAGEGMGRGRGPFDQITLHTLLGKTGPSK